jgi:hypothetical protein
VALNGCHCLSGAIRIGGSGEHGPRLRYGIDPAFVVLHGAERRSIVEGAAPIPFAVPGVPFQRGLNRCPVRAPTLGALRIARFSVWSEKVDGPKKKPGQPDAFAPAGLAHPIHAVVPVARPDQRQAVLAGKRDALVETAGAVFE